METIQLLSTRKMNYQKDEQGFMLMNSHNLLALCIKDELYEQPELNTKIYLHYQGFKKIENLEKYKNLKTLWLENNCINKIENIGHLVNLNSLFLHNNTISKIENLDNLACLTVLKLQHNQIAKIEGLECLRFLENIDLSSNHLENYEAIQGLEDCPSLTNINISDNQIAYDENILELFKKMPNLACLYSKGNPFQRETKQFRRNYIIQLNNLKYLDDRPIFEEERELCEAWKRGGREAELAQRAEINERKRQFHRDYVRDIGDKQTKVKQARIRLFQNSLERKQKEIEEMEQRIQKWSDENMNQMNIDSLQQQILEEKQKVNGLKETISNMNIFVHKNNKAITVTKTGEGEIIVHNQTQQEAERIKKEFYPEETLEYEKKQQLKQEKNEQKLEHELKNQSQQQIQFVLQNGKIDYSSDFDELLELLLKQNNFDYCKTLEEMKILISQIEKKDIELNFDAEVLQFKWYEIEKRQVNSSQQSTIDLDELD